MFLQLFSIINGVNVSKPQYLSSDWLHTACQVSFIKKYCNLKISSLFRGYLWISPVNIFEQPHGSDQCGYIHLLYRFVCSFTVVEVWPLCRLGCLDMSRWLLMQKYLATVLVSPPLNIIKLQTQPQNTRVVRLQLLVSLISFTLFNVTLPQNIFLKQR